MTDAPLNGVVTVGTDHHRFDRLMDWLERWDAQHPGVVRWVVQHGSSRPMARSHGFAIKPRPELLEILHEADLVVTQGGPGGIMDSRESGTVPIVVPRLSRLDEVVDDHQVAFAEQLARRGLVVLARSEAQLFSSLDQAVAHPAAFRIIGQSGSDVGLTVGRFATAVADLLERKPAGRRRSPRPVDPVA